MLDHHILYIIFLIYKVETTRSFYINLEAPSAAFKGEQIGIQVGVFSYNSQPDEVNTVMYDM